MIQHDLSYQCFHRIPTAHPARNSRLWLRKPGVTNGRPIHRAPRAHQVTCARFLWEPQSQSERGHPSLTSLRDTIQSWLLRVRNMVLSEIRPPNHQWSTLAFLVDAKQKPGMLNWNVACIGARYMSYIHNTHAHTHTHIYIYVYVLYVYMYNHTRANTHIYIVIFTHAQLHTYALPWCMCHLYMYGFWHRCVYIMWRLCIDPYMYGHVHI